MIKTTDISLEQVVDCHLIAFPNSIYNLFGRNFISKVFQWYIDGSDLKHLFVYVEDNKIVGFLTARIKSYKGSFIRYIFPSLFNSLLRSPLLVFNIRIIKEGIIHFSQYFRSERLVVHTQDNKILLTMSLGVNPIYRRKKIGSKLFKAAEYLAISKGCHYIEASGIHSSNKESIMNYKKINWVEAGINSSGYIIYKKALNFQNKNIDLSKCYKNL